MSRQDNSLTMLKRINQAEDMPLFAASEAKAKLHGLVEYISSSVTGTKTPKDPSPHSQPIVELLARLEALLGKVELKEGPQRFGNPAFRLWHQQALDIIADLGTLGVSVTNLGEATEYLSLSFGNPQRLDYGTGHELAFLAFFGTIVEGYGPEDMLVVWDSYYKLSRAVILRYKLEPAGSHGVWGLDDHYHLCYIFGASQLLPKPQGPQGSSTAGNTENIPTPHDINEIKIINKWAPVNLYFSAIKFITVVKNGPFHEHSPMLYNASAAANWTKIKNGMTRMYGDVVFGKFPVVQHFVFGEMYRFDALAPPSH